MSFQAQVREWAQEGIRAFVEPLEKKITSALDRLDKLEKAFTEMDQVQARSGGRENKPSTDRPARTSPSKTAQPKTTTDK
jgi:hypothetical protein